MTKEIKTILVPIDFTAESEHALEYGAILAKRFAASIHLVHACQVPCPSTSSKDGSYALADWALRLGEEAEGRLTEVALQLAEVKVTTEVLFGHPAKCIVSAAVTNVADLIVMGTHGYWPAQPVEIGDVAERVVSTAPCPVLAVRGPLAVEWHRPRIKAGAMAAAMGAMSVLWP